MATDLNPYEAIGQLQARKVHERRVATIKAEKTQDDQRTQFKLFLKANRAQLTALLSNPLIGDKVLALIKFLRRLGPHSSAQVLVDYIENSQWLHNADENVRIVMLSYIDSAIIRIRVQQGLPPFDDSIGDEPPTAFQIIRKILMGV